MGRRRPWWELREKINTLAPGQGVRYGLRDNAILLKKPAQIGFNGDKKMTHDNATIASPRVECMSHDCE